MGSLYDTIKQNEEQKKRATPVTPITSTPPASFTPLSIKLLTQPRTGPTQAEMNRAKVSEDMSRGVIISQGTEDPIQKARQSLSKIPFIGKFLTGTGPQGPSNSLYEPGSMQQSLVENGIVGFMLEGFQKKVSPTRAEIGDQIFSRYEKLADVEPDENRRLNIAIQDVVNRSVSQKNPQKFGAKSSIDGINNPGMTLSEKEKDALFWTNLIEDTFAVLDAPVFVGSTKIPKNALLIALKDASKVEDVIPRLRMIGISEEVATDIAPKIAKSTNEIQIARYIKQAEESTQTAKGPSLFSRIQESITKKGDVLPAPASAIDELEQLAKKPAVDTPPPVPSTIKDFGTFKRVDVEKVVEEPYVSRFENGFMGKVADDGITYRAKDKMGMLNTQLKQAGFKGVNTSTDFKGIYALDKIIDNPALFEKYPTLKEVNVVFADFHTPKKYGMHVGNDIYINSKLYKANPAKMESTIVHEIQHAKQDIRGMVGISDEIASGKVKRAYDSTREVDARRKQQQYLDSVAAKTSPKTQTMAEKAGNIAKSQIPARMITADKLRLTDKAAARRLSKLENMAETATNVDRFVDRTGITREALEKTVQKQGYKNVDEFYKVNKPKQISKEEMASRRAMTEPDTRPMPNDEETYSIMADEWAGDKFAIATKKNESEAVVENLRAVFADMKGVDMSDVKKFTEEDLDQMELQYQFAMDSLMDDPARALSRYANKYGELPEVTGKLKVQSRTGNGVEIANSKFGIHGDDITKSLGFDTSDEALKAFDAYKKRKTAVQNLFLELQQIRNSIRLSKQMDTFVGKNQKALALELQKNQSALANIVKAAERGGFRKGVAEGNKKYEKLVDILRTRRHAIGGIKWRYNLSYGEMKKAMEYAHNSLKELDIPEDPRFMTKDEFTQYTAKLEEYADMAEKKRIERGIVKVIIEQKELKNTENLREVMGLPTLSEMSLEELGRYEKVLNKFQDGDEFLSKRTLEVIDRTALKGARTIRQTQEYLAKEIKNTLGRDVSPGELQNLTAGASDYLRWDTSLAESKPFYGFLVHKAQKHIMDGEMNFVRIQDRIFKLAEKAKKSRVVANSKKIEAIKRELKTTTDPDARRALTKRMKGLGWRANAKQKLVPTYTRIIKYLESRGDEKEMFWKTLTKEEQDYAVFIRNYYNSAYNYLSYINELHGSRYIDAYFTHVRKGFLEKWTDDGFIAAIKNIWDAQKEDMAIANIIDSDTGKILPKSKFFQYTLQRTGEGEVSQNLTRVFLQYAKLLERKKMLDKMVPELDIYTNSLTPKELTQKGLEMDRTMKEFVNNYINNKRGRRFNFGGIIKQNGPADVLLRMGNTLVSFGDLGLNFLAGSASMVGEQVSNFVALGNKATMLGFKRRIWDTGMKRLLDPKATQILKEAEPFIGRNIWTELAEVDKPIFEKAMQTMFGLFSQSSVEANKIFLLGSLTKEELKAGKISAQRMADLRLEAGRWRDMGDSVKSIVGSTSPGAAWTKYKGWALPIMRTSVKNITDISSMLKKGNFKEAMTAKQTKELMRTIEVTTLALIVGQTLTAEEGDDSALAKLRNRIKQETLTILGGVDPTVFLATPRLYSWMQQLASNLKQIALLEEYQSDSKYGAEGDLKGIGGLKQQFTPGFLRQFMSSSGKGTSTTMSDIPSSSGKTGLDDLNSLNDLEASLKELDQLNGLKDLNSLKELDALSN